MGQRFLMGLDAGSGGGRCLLVDVNTGEVVTASRPWKHPIAPGTGGWGFNLETDSVWSLLGEAAREVLHRANATPDEVLGVAAVGMRHGMVVIDEDGSELLATPNRDARAAAKSMHLGDERGSEFHQRTGHWPAPLVPAVRLLWMAEKAPDLLAHTHALLSISDWLAFRLTGNIAAEASQAGETLLFDLHTRDWAWDLIASLSLPNKIFPQVVTAGSRLGSLTEAAAAGLGLRAGIPVSVGGADTQAGLLGGGAVNVGQLCALAGTTAPIQLVLAQPVIDPQARLWTGHHIVPGLWVLESNAGTTGEALEWIATTLHPTMAQPVATFIAEAGESRPGAAGILSTFGTALFNAGQLDLPVGSLTLSHLLLGNKTSQRQHLARAVLEGMAYGIQANIEQIVEVAGIAQPPLRLAGGMSRSALWSQIVSDVTGAPVQLPATPEASALGAAICAGVGAGLYDDPIEGANALVRITREHVPDTENRQTYRTLYEGWMELRDASTEAENIAAGMALQASVRAPSSAPGFTDGPTFHPRIFITAALDEDAVQALRELGDVEYASYREEMRLLAGEDLVEALQGSHIFITEVDILDADAIKKLPDLRLVVVCRGSPINVDVGACTMLGIPVLNTPGRNAGAVADLTVAFMLMLARKLPEATRFLREPGGEAGDMGRMGMAHYQLQGNELWNKTVGLVGMGAVGRQVTQRLLPFGVRILAHDPYLNSEKAPRYGVELVSLEKLLAESDFVSLHAVVTDESRGMIGTEQLARMKAGSYLINTARAALIDEEALVEALVSDHLAGAALDVFAVEPPGSDHPLLSLPNVIATPHIGGNTVEVSTHQGVIVVEELKRVLCGERPRNLLNSETFDNFEWHPSRRAPSSERLKELDQSVRPTVSDLGIEAKGARIAATQAAEATEVPKEKNGVLARLRRLVVGEKESGSDVESASDQATDRMMHILQAFIDHLTTDEPLLNFSINQDLTVHYILTDFDQEFYMRFDDGAVIAGLGGPDSTPDVTLKMKANILDGMFTGRINAMRAAMTGKLSFSGDTAKAMSLQKISEDLARLYTRVREEIGAPDDLINIPTDPEPTATQPIPTADRTVTVSTSQEGDERHEIVQIVNELYAARLITSTGGNVSVRVSGDKDQVWITPSQVFKGDLRADMMVRIDLEGNPLDLTAGAASSERYVHCAIMRNRPDVNAVIHTHAPQATILALNELPFLPISTEAAFIGEIPRVPFIMPGTRELADAVVEALGSGPAVLMQNHGLVVAGNSLRRAADMTEIIEQTAEKIVMCYTIGKAPPVLPDEVVALLREVGEMRI